MSLGPPLKLKRPFQESENFAGWESLNSAMAAITTAPTRQTARVAQPNPPPKIQYRSLLFFRLMHFPKP